MTLPLKAAYAQIQWFMSEPYLYHIADRIAVAVSDIGRMTR